MIQYKFVTNDQGLTEIHYNGKSYGDWNDVANIDYPEDLTLARDLKDLIDIGIEIGMQIEKDKGDALNKNQ